jgi:hypothetical protein
MASAKMRKVRRVPTSGMNRRAEPRVPTREPAVDSAYSRPATVPASSTLDTASRMAYGDTAPSSRTGTATSPSTPISEPTNAPADTESSASTATCSSGSAANGTSARRPAAVSASRHRPRM